MTVTYREDHDAGLIELTVSGRVTREDFDALQGRVQDFIDAHETVKLIEVIESFDGMDASMLLPGIRFDLRNMARFSHVAVVTDIGWLSPLSRALGALTPMRLRVFALDEEQQAREWIAQG